MATFEIVARNGNKLLDIEADRYGRRLDHHRGGP